MQGALWPQEAPCQDRADLFTHGVEMGDEAVGHLRDKWHRGVQIYLLISVFIEISYFNPTSHFR